MGLIFPVRSTFLTINNFLDKGGGYSGKEWNNAEILNFLKFIPQNSDKKLFIYSNYPHAVYFLANTYAKWSPPKTYYNSNTIYENLSDLEGTWPPRNSVYLVWFRQQGQRDWLYTPKELMTISNMKIIDSVNTGSIYLVSRVKK